MTKNDELSDKKPHTRSIRSFVLRQGRMTEGQTRAFDTLWPQYGIELDVDDEILALSTLFTPAKENIVLEIGFGNGESLLEMAAAAPETGFIGIEVHAPGVGHALMGIEARKLENLRIIRADAVEVLTHHIADMSLARVQIYFPDPWPKLRHHKRRIIQPAFTDLLHRKLRPNGELHLATDWENYAQWMRDILHNDEKWHTLGDETGFSPRPTWRPETKFERRGIGKGHGVWDLRYQRV